MYLINIRLPTPQCTASLISHYLDVLSTSQALIILGLEDGVMGNHKVMGYSEAQQFLR